MVPTAIVSEILYDIVCKDDQMFMCADRLMRLNGTVAPMKPIDPQPGYRPSDEDMLTIIRYLTDAFSAYQLQEGLRGRLHSLRGQKTMISTCISVLLRHHQLAAADAFQQYRTNDVRDFLTRLQALMQLEW